MLKHIFIIHLFAMLTILLGTEGIAQGDMINSSWLTQEEGLPFRHVNHLMRDRAGYVWMVGKSKLARFDGKNYKIYSNQTASAPQLSIRGIKSIIQTMDDNIWLHGDEQINVLNPHLDSIVYRVGNEEFRIQNMFLHKEQVLLQAIDDQRSYLLKCIDTFHFDTIHIFDEDPYFFQLTLDAAEKALYYVDNYFRLMLVDLDSKESKVLDTIEFENRRYHQNLKLSHDGDGKLWVYELTGASYVPIYWNTKESKLTPIEWPEFNMKIIAEENDSLWWFFNRDNRRPTLINMHSQTFVDNIPNSRNVKFTDFSRINENEIWFSSERGIFKNNRLIQSQFHHLLHVNEPLGTQISTRAMIELPNGDLFISAYGSALIIRTNDKKVDRIRIKREGKLGLLPIRNFMFLDTIAGRVWMRGTDKKLSYLELIEGTIQDKCDWIVPKGKQKGIINFGNRLVQCKNYDAISSIVLNARINMPVERGVKDKDWIKGVQMLNGKYYIATALGVGVLDANLPSLDKQTIKLYDFIERETRIFDLAIDNSGTVWIGTNNGLYAHDVLINNVSHYTVEDGLSDNRIASILFDENNLMWLATFNGLTRFDPATNQLWTYFKQDGIADNEFNHNSKLRLSDGRLIFGGINGLTVFDPAGISLAKTDPSPFVLTNYATYAKGDAELIDHKEGLGNLTQIELGAFNKYFRFEFALLDFTKTHLHKYRWYLDGFEKHWQPESNTAAVQYNNIPAGNYTFKAQAANANGVWNPNIISINVSIAQIFYKQWWFVGLLSLVIISIVNLIYRTRLKRALEFERLRTKIASDLHDEVGSRMTRISLASEILKSDIYSDEERATELENISTQSRIVTSTMSDVIWSIDGRKDSLIDLLDRMRDHCEELLVPAQIEYSFKSPWTGRNSSQEISTTKLDFILRQNIYFIFKEALHNIVKHADASEVLIVLENTPSNFIMTIKDNGLGVSFHNKKSGQGLSNMKMRASRLQGDLTFGYDDGFEVKLLAPTIR